MQIRRADVHLQQQIALVTCQDIKTLHTQQIVNAAGCGGAS
jgi:hypothetical protein